MTAQTTITCTKSQFAFYLGKAFVPVTALSPDQFSELSEVIDGLVRQADEHRGTFTGHSAYLDLDFTVYPEPTFRTCCGAAMTGPHEDGCLGPTAVTGENDETEFCGCPKRADGDHAQGCSAGLDLLNGLDAPTKPKPLTDTGCTWPSGIHQEAANGRCPRCGKAVKSEITIPTVTDAQRDEARDSAYATAHHAVRVLRRQLDIGQLNPETFDQFGDALKAAAGHLRIANGDEGTPMWVARFLAS